MAYYILADEEISGQSPVSTAYEVYQLDLMSKRLSSLSEQHHPLSTKSSNIPVL